MSTTEAKVDAAVAEPDQPAEGRADQDLIGRLVA